MPPRGPQIPLLKRAAILALHWHGGKSWIEISMMLLVHPETARKICVRAKVGKPPPPPPEQAGGCTPGQGLIIPGAGDRSEPRIQLVSTTSSSTSRTWSVQAGNIGAPRSKNCRGRTRDEKSRKSMFGRVPGGRMSWEVLGLKTSSGVVVMLAGKIRSS